jgi:preprotein translocase subunit YajC
MILLQASGMAGILNMVMPLGIIIIFYFFIIRPQQQKLKSQQSFVDTIEKGKEIVTNGGIIGRINRIEGSIVTLQIANNTFIRIVKGAISKEMTEALATNTTDDTTVAKS